MTNKTYQQTILEWRKEREQSIRKENGWLALSGLFWLKPGKNRIGSDPACEVNLPKGATAEIGYLDYDGKSVVLLINPGQSVKVNDKSIAFAILEPDVANNPSFISLDDLRLVVIQRGNRMGVRLWDNQRAARRLFPPRTWYEIDEGFCVSGRYTAYDRPKMVFSPDVTGEKTEYPVEGFISFEFSGRAYQLDVTKEEDESLFVRFWDPTSKSETYPAGRYLIAKMEKDGKAALDFNYAYNPPCAFTDFATCVFAPEQNWLDFRIEAGETYKHH
ncbi:MAG: hypothetical protein A2W33_08205 [Chloroflexi bacterium RBG_16_52_11]|nr:MAG: hypothetical protein A2W33_08205 [Chloroflexi bacterium RBG_16_52_11]